MKKRTTSAIGSSLGGEDKVLHLEQRKVEFDDVPNPGAEWFDPATDFDPGYKFAKGHSNGQRGGHYSSLPGDAPLKDCVPRFQSDCKVSQENIKIYQEFIRNGKK